jgi:hypothetical protein
VADRESGDGAEQWRVDERERLGSGGDGNLPAGCLRELHEVLDLRGGRRRADDHIEHASRKRRAHLRHLLHRIGRVPHPSIRARGNG